MRGDTIGEAVACREKLWLGFKHVVREGFVERSNLSQSHVDKWMTLVPPTVGVMRYRRDATIIFWTIEEHPREVGNAQFY